MPNKKKNTKKKYVSKTIGIVFMIAAILVLLSVGRQVYTLVSLQRQADQVEKELQALKDENASLIATKEKLEDPNYVQTYARGEYMFSKGDEKVFYLPANNEGSE